MAALIHQLGLLPRFNARWRRNTGGGEAGLTCRPRVSSIGRAARLRSSSVLHKGDGLDERDILICRPILQCKVYADLFYVTIGSAHNDWRGPHATFND